MVLFNKFVTCALDTNVHGAFPDWYDGGKTTLTLGGDTESCALLKCDYSQSPNYGSGELHSAKLLIYPTSTSKTRAYIEPSRFKVYKVNRQLENEGSLDAVTTDLIIGASHQPNDGVTFYEETFTGRDIDGDGIPDKGESVTFTAYERIVRGMPYLTLSEALALKDGIWDNFTVTDKSSKAVEDKFVTVVGGQKIIAIQSGTEWGWTGRVRRWYPIFNSNSTNAAGKSSKNYLNWGGIWGELSWKVEDLKRVGLPHWGRTSSSTTKMNKSVESVATTGTTFFDVITYSESHYGGDVSSLG